MFEHFCILQAHWYQILLFYLLVHLNILWGKFYHLLVLNHSQFPLHLVIQIIVFHTQLTTTILKMSIELHLKQGDDQWSWPFSRKQKRAGTSIRKGLKLKRSLIYFLHGFEENISFKPNGTTFPPGPNSVHISLQI